MNMESWSTHELLSFNSNLWPWLWNSSLLLTVRKVESYACIIKRIVVFYLPPLCALNRSKAILFFFFCKAILDQHDLLHWIEDDTMWAEIKRMGEELSRWSREGRMLQANLRVERSKNREHYGWNREGRGEYGSGWSWRDRKEQATQNLKTKGEKIWCFEDFLPVTL